MPAWEFGVASPQCDKARLAHGLVPLQPTDWPDPIESQPLPQLA
jgi:hypothetical protein